MYAKKINILDRFSSITPQLIGLIIIASLMLMVFFVPSRLFSILITLCIAFAILLFLFSYKKLRSFVMIAIIEHIVLLVALSAMVYTKPPVKKDINNATIEADIILPTKEEEKKEPQKSIPQVTKSDMKLPPLETKSAVSKYLSASEEDIISSVPSHSRSYQLSPGGLATGNINRTTGEAEGGESDSEFMIKDVRSPQTNGEYKPSSRFNLSSEGGRKPSYGRVGPTTSGRVATGSALEHSEKVQKGSGLFEIRGEISGRRVTYWPEIPEVRGEDVGAVVLTFVVNPEGEVVSVSVKRKAGEPLLEKKAKLFVEQIRFARLPSSVEQKLQRGEITIDFTKKLNR